MMPAETNEAPHATSEQHETRIAGYWNAHRSPSPSGKTARYFIDLRGYHHTVAFRALCQDGRVRTVRAAQSADTWHSHPGRVTFGKKTKRGFVSFENGEYHFTVYRQAPNAT